MPQLDFSTFTPQLVWLAIWFVVLYLLMAKLGLPRIAAVVEARRRRREDDLARAAQMKSEVVPLLSSKDKLLKETGDRLAAKAAQRQRALAADLASQIAAAEQRIADTKEAALSEVRGIAIDVGRSVVEKLTGSAPEAASLAAAVDRSLAGQAH